MSNFGCGHQWALSADAADDPLVAANACGEVPIRASRGISLPNQRALVLLLGGGESPVAVSVAAAARCYRASGAEPAERVDGIVRKRIGNHIRCQ